MHKGGNKCVKLYSCQSKNCMQKKKKESPVLWQEQSSIIHNQKKKKNSRGQNQEMTELENSNKTWI